MRLKTSMKTILPPTENWLTTGGFLGDPLAVNLSTVTGFTFEGTAHSSGLNNTENSFYVLQNFNASIEVSGVAPEPSTTMLGLVGALVLTSPRKKKQCKVS